MESGDVRMIWESANELERRSSRSDKFEITENNKIEREKETKIKRKEEKQKRTCKHSNSQCSISREAQHYSHYLIVIGIHTRNQKRKLLLLLHQQHQRETRRKDEYRPRQNSPAVGLERRRGEEREDVTRWEWIAFMRRRAAEEESIFRFDSESERRMIRRL